MFPVSKPGKRKILHHDSPSCAGCAGQQCASVSQFMPHMRFVTPAACREAIVLNTQSRYRVLTARQVGQFLVCPS